MDILLLWRNPKNSWKMSRSLLARLGRYEVEIALRVVSNAWRTADMIKGSAVSSRL